jgi:hypothetical protein
MRRRLDWKNEIAQRSLAFAFVAGFIPGKKGGGKKTTA